jgi:hypothetical protein
VFPRLPADTSPDSSRFERKEQNRPAIWRKRGDRDDKERMIMLEQIEDQESTTLVDEIISEVAEKRIERAAEEAAEKSTKTEQRHDRDHPIFSK